MDLDKLKDSLSEEEFTGLSEYVSALESQRDQARSESIDKRKSLQASVKALETDRQSLLEKLGVESMDDAAELPEARGTGEALQQAEAKAKRLERDLSATMEKLTQSEERSRSTMKRITIAEAMGGHDWVARDIVESFVSPRLEWDGDELLYKDDGGNLIPVKDGITAIAKTRPELLKPAGAGGPGVGSRGARGADGQKSMTRAEFDALPAEQKMAAAKEGVQLH